MVIKVKFALLCDSAELDERTKKVNIRGIFDKIFGPENAQHPEMTLFVHFEKDSASHILELHSKHQDGSIIRPKKEIEISANSKPTANLILQIKNFPLKQHGNYHFDLKENGKSLVKIPFVYEQASHT
jgi:hypothetical protein